MQPEARFLMAYCERLGSPAFWAEPLNALTNAGFVLAAGMAFWLWRQRHPRDVAGLVLILLMTAIGIGSFLFHTIPNRRTVLMDVLPIQGFILLYFGLAIRRFLGAPLWLAWVGPVLFFVASAGLVQVAGPNTLRGGIGYVPALLALFGFGLALAARSRRAEPARAGLTGDAARPIARALLLAGGLFTLSLALRTLDRPLCSAWPWGLHFLWHLLNATVLGLLALAAIRAVTPR
ncbi:MAG: ceramidase domain-containing protein [Beijerinckiaceae bacterium]|nr:ceramidase domain-containing protein [Brevundimonas sp.]MCZ8302082.1 ceramidase domain-containing protein [Beijerinckiaceae bacterium]